MAGSRRSLDDYERHTLYAGLALVAVAVVLVWVGASRKMVTGEGLYDLMFVDRFPFWQSIREFFVNRIEARFMHGAFLAVLYQFFGFNPPLLYLSAQVLVIISAVAIVLLLKDTVKPGWRVFLLVLLLCLLPTLTPQLISFKKIHHALAWSSFWISALCLRQLIFSKKWYWFAGSLLFFCIAVLSYEAIALLLPLAIFLSASKIKKYQNWLRYLGLATLITLVGFSLRFYLNFQFGVTNARIAGIGIFEIILSPIISVTRVTTNLMSKGLSFPTFIPAFVGWVGELIAVLLLVAGFYLLIEGLWAAWRKKKTLQKNSTFWLALAGLWLVFVTYLPFFAIGQPPNEDNLVGVGYGLVLLLVATSLLVGRPSKGQWERLVLIGVGTFLVAVGLFSYAHQVSSAAKDDQRFATFVLSLKSLVPGVRENTTFILVNTNWGRTGCIGYMNMLYLRNNLHCIHLLDGDTEESYRYDAGGLVEDSGRVYAPDFIILHADEDSKATVLDSITKAEYPEVPMTWENNDIVVTNQDRIISNENDTSPFFEYILHHYSEPQE